MSIDPGPVREVYLVLVYRDDAWRPYDWRLTVGAANELAMRLKRDGLRVDVRVNVVRPSAAAA